MSLLLHISYELHERFLFSFLLNDQQRLLGRNAFCLNNTYIPENKMWNAGNVSSCVRKTATGINTKNLEEQAAEK